MKAIIPILAFSIITASAMDVRSQGCSDAGVCTIDGMKHTEEPDTFSVKKNTISAGLFFGMSQHSVVVLTPFVKYSRELGRHVSLTAKFNYGFRMGELANTHGPSDLLLSVNYHFLNHFSVTGGVKVPLSDANKQVNGQSLPMNYQTSLGTVDILVGFGYKIRRFSITAGYQQPVTQNNNQFLATDYPEKSPESKYYSTRNYHRAADVMLRVSFKAIKSKKINLIAGVLPIYHVQNDSYQKPDGERISLAGSQGLTLNLSATLQYKFLGNQLIELIAGAPVVSRKVRPDGLSTFAVGIAYKISL